MFKHTLTRRLLAAGLATGAAGFPSLAEARVDLNPLPAPTSSAAQVVVTASQQRRLDQLDKNVRQWFAVHGHFASALSSVPATSSSVPAPATSQRGFQWGDAGIGAAGIVVLLGAGATATGAMRRRRAHRAVTG